MMRDYEELSKRLRHCPAGNPSICQLNYELEEGGFCQGCEIKFEAADAIEELLAAEPPLLWTDEPIEGTEFMTHSQGGRKGFEIHFRTDSLEKYKAVQEECRRQIGHSKPEPPKGVE